MIAITRFRVPLPGGDFARDAAAVVERFNAAPGCLSVELVANLDDPELWALVSRWIDVGSYRRAFNGTEAKFVLLPLMSLAIDEPGAYADPAWVGENRPRGTVG